MPRTKSKKKRAMPMSGAAQKYDGHHSALHEAYGLLADLRNELSGTKSEVTERRELLELFSRCTDPQRAWLLLEDYFGKLKLSRKDFPGEDWWTAVHKAAGGARLEQLAVVFMRTGRPVPAELAEHANRDRFAEIQEAESERLMLLELEHWMFPPAPHHLDTPRAAIRAFCRPQAVRDSEELQTLNVQFVLRRPRNGDQKKSIGHIADLVTRAAHEQELFSAGDWEFIEWITEHYADEYAKDSSLSLSGQDLLTWLARWGDTGRLSVADSPAHYQFHGQIAELTPDLQNGQSELSFTHRLHLPDGTVHLLKDVHFFEGKPTLVLVGDTFCLLRNSPPASLLSRWVKQPVAPARKLSHRFITHLRRAHLNGLVDWDQLCIAHQAKPRFVFEMNGDRVELRLQALSDTDGSLWEWTGHEWHIKVKGSKSNGKPQILDDARLQPAIDWLRQLDWFTPEPGLWLGDANENFLNVLASVWASRPPEAEYLANPNFQRLFLHPKRLKPKLLVKGSGIDWLSVCAEWEIEGMKLTRADLEHLAAANSRFVKLPDGGWVELDVTATQKAQEAMAEMGVDGLHSDEQKISLEQAAHLNEAALNIFGNTAQAKKLRERLSTFEGIPATVLPKQIHADLRPYQCEGFSFLCHQQALGLGAILADDMGLGKTLQTLTYLVWLKNRYPRQPKPVLVICPASVMYNWQREAERFAPGTKVLVLESGTARHGLRKEIPKHDIVVTNYALLRRDLEELQKFDFRAVILDEAQFIKNPGAQITQSVKQVQCDHRLALTGTPLENRLLDLWSIVDFVQPGYLGSAKNFHDTYEPPGESTEAINARAIARRRLGARLRPIMLRRIKQQVAKDLPERIEQRHDCELNDDQRKLYLAELRRSRDQVMQTIATQGVAKSRMQVLSALTRLRQICCHPALVGNDSISGKTESLFELVTPLIERGEKVLIFSQFVRMLKLIEAECQKRGINTHTLTGETKDRQEVVNAFQDDPNACVFLLSLRAAGTGLNLTTASYVVLYDPWWNPAVEAQAIDRTHRIGQTKTVNAYRLIAPRTVEEKIWDLQQSKSKTIADVLGEEGFAKSLSKSDLEFLFSEG